MNVPKIRFKGFNGEWKKEKADNLFQTTNERNRPDLPVLSAFQDIRGMAVREGSGYDISHNKKNEVTYKVVHPGQFVMHLRSFQGGFAHSSVLGITSPAYTIFDFKNNVSQFDLYWKIIFMSKSFVRRLNTITYGIRDGRSINFEEFKRLKFNMPSFSEQRAIASFFQNLDSLIQGTEKKIASLRQMKEASLQAMFPAEGETVPKVRFKGFDGEWKKVKLGDCLEISSERNQNNKYTIN